MSTMTITSTRGVLPRVNLLPPEFAERRKLRRVQAGLGVGVLASVAAVAALYVGAVADVAEAQAGLDESVARNVELQNETGQYAEVPRVFADVAAAETRVRLTMASEVQWSKSLKWLATQTPKGVWLSTLNVTQADAAAAAATAPANGWSVAGVGTVTFEGKAYRYQDVATWMETLAKGEGFTQPYVTTAAVEESLLRNGKPVISFSSRVVVDERRLSNRHPIKKVS